MTTLNNNTHLSSQQVSKARVLCKFWGDDSQGIALRPQNSVSKDLCLKYSTEATYDIFCSIWHFHKYLLDMGKLKLQIVDQQERNIGIVVINFKMFVSKNVDERSTALFSPFKEIFPIIVDGGIAGNNCQGNEFPKKVGDLEVEMISEFDKQKSLEIKKEKDIKQKQNQEKNVTTDFDVITDQENNSNLSNKSKQCCQVDFRNLHQTEVEANEEEGNEHIYNQSQKRSLNNVQEAERETPSSEQIDKLLFLKPGNEVDDSGAGQSDQIKCNNINTKLEEIIEIGKNLFQCVSSKAEETQHQTKEFKNQADYTQLKFTEGLIGETFRDSDKFIEYKLPKIGELQSLQTVACKSQNQPMEKRQEREIPTASSMKQAESNVPNFVKLILSKDTLKVRIVDFHCSNDDFLKKVKERNLFIETVLPQGCQLLKQCERSYDSFKTFCKELSGETFTFDQDFTFKVSFQEDVLEQTSRENLIFSLNTFVMPQKDSFSEKLTMELAHGTFPLQKVFSAINFQGTFYVNMWTKIPVTNKQKQEKGVTKFISLSRNELLERAQKDENLMGQIQVTISLISTKLEEYKERGNEIQGVERSKGSSSHHQQSRSQEKLLINPNITTTFQLLFRLGKLRIITAARLDLSYNYFARYKVFGTSEAIQTDVQWDQVEPDLSHRMIAPMNFEQLIKMAKTPFLVEIWNKSQYGDQIVGIIRFNLQNIPKLVLNSEMNDYSLNWIQTQSQLIVVLNEMVNIKDLKGVNDKGMIFATIVFGTASKICTFDSTLSTQSQPQLGLSNLSGIPMPIPPPNMQTIAAPQKQLRQCEKEHSQNLSQRSLYVDNNSAKKELINNNENDLGSVNNEGDLPVEQTQESQCSGLEDFMNLLEQIRRNSGKVQDKLKRFVLAKKKEPQVTKQKLAEFLLELDVGLRPAKVERVLNLLIDDPSGLLQLENFTKSYAAFVNYEAELRERATTVVKGLVNLLENNGQIPGELERKLQRESEFGLMRRDKFRDVFHKDLKLFGMTNILLEDLCNLLDIHQDGFLFVSYLGDYIRSIQDFQELRSLNLSSQWFSREVEKTICRAIHKAALQIEDFIDQNEDSNLLKTSQYNCKDIVFLLGLKLQIDMSLFEGISAIERAKQFRLSKYLESEKDEQKQLFDSSQHQISRDTLLEWIRNIIQKEIVVFDTKLVVNEEEVPQAQTLPQYLMENKKGNSSYQSIEENQNKDLNQLPVKNDNLSNKQSNNMDEIDMLSGLLNDKDNGKMCELFIDECEEQRSQRKQDGFQELESNQKELRLSQKAIEQTKQKLVNHLFSISLIGLDNFLLFDYFEQEVLKVNFTFCGEAVDSAPIVYKWGQTSYTLKGHSEHTIILKSSNENLENLLYNPSKELVFKICKANNQISIGYAYLNIEKIIEIKEKAKKEHESQILKAKQTFEIPIQINEFFSEDLHCKTVGQLIIEVQYLQNCQDEKEKLSKNEIIEEQMQENGKNNIGNELQQHIIVSQESSTLIEKETNINKYLPKSGFISIQLKAMTNFKRILKESEYEVLNENGGFCLQMDFILFAEDDELQQNASFPIISSSINYNNLEDVLTIDEERPITLSNQLIEYFSQQSGCIRVRLWPIGLLNNKSQMTKQSIQIFREIEIVGIVYFPLVDLLINQVIKGELALKRENEVNQFAGIVEVNLQYAKEKILCPKENKVAQKNIQKTEFVKSQQQEPNLFSLLLIFREIINLNDLEEDFIITFMINHNQTNLVSSTPYKLRNDETILLMDKNYIRLDFANSSELQEVYPIYIDVVGTEVNGSNQVKIGSICISLKGLLQQGQLETNVINNYFTVMSQHNEKLQQSSVQQLMQMRVGIKICFLAFNDQSHMERCNEFTQQLSNLIRPLSNQFEFEENHKNPVETLRCLLQLSRIDFDNSLQDLMKTISDDNNRQRAIRELSSNFILSEDLIQMLQDNRELFQSFESHNIQQYQNPLYQHGNTKQNEFIEEFGIFDYDNCGFINCDNLNRVLTRLNLTTQYIQKQKSNIAYQLTPSQMDSLGLDRNIEKFGVSEYCDYVILISSLMLHKSSFDRQQRVPLQHQKKILASIQESPIIQKEIDSSNCINRFGQNDNEDTLTVRHQHHIYRLKIVIENGFNFGSLQLGVSPNSFIRCSQPDFETNLIYRNSNPNFNYCFETQVEAAKLNDFVKIELQVMQRSYNQDHRDQLYRNEVIGTAILNLQQLLLTNCCDSIRQEKFKLEIIAKDTNSKCEFNQYNNTRISSNNPAYLTLNVAIELIEKFNLFNINNKNKYQKISSNKKQQREEENIQQFGDFNENFIKNFHQTLSEVSKGEEGLAFMQLTDEHLAGGLFSETKETMQSAMQSINKIQESLQAQFESNQFKLVSEETNLPNQDLNNLKQQLKNENLQYNSDEESNLVKKSQNLNNIALIEADQIDYNINKGIKNTFDNEYSPTSYRRNQLSCNQNEEFNQKAKNNQITQISDKKTEQYTFENKEKQFPCKQQIQAKKIENNQQEQISKQYNIINSNKQSKVCYEIEDKDDYEYLDKYSKPQPIQKKDSLTKLKEFEKQIHSKMKNSQELNRIANIMKEDQLKSKKLFDYSSDSD